MTYSVYAPKALLRHDCPQFRHHEAGLPWTQVTSESILGWATRELRLDVTFSELPSCWAMTWLHSPVYFPEFYLPTDGARANFAAALYIYLWCQEIPPKLARQLAVSYTERQFQEATGGPGL